MPNLVFALELGAGFGHLVPIAALAQQCRQRGHNVVLS